MKKIWTLFLAVGLAIVLSVGIASADQYNLGVLIRDDLSFVWYDKVFDDWGFQSATVDPFSVTIRTIGEPYNPGISIQGPFVTAGSSDSGLFYSVATVSGAPLIKDISQFFNLTAVGTGGTVAIGETVFNAAGGQIAQSTVSFYLVGDYNDPPGEPTLGDVLVFDPVSKLWVTKDITLLANQGGFVGATIIGQKFSQVAVPEPASMLLLGSGLIGLAGFARKRFRKN